MSGSGAWLLCAWILWETPSPRVVAFSAHSAYDTREACQSEALRLNQADRSMRRQCWPVGHKP
jgi:hypothetical protein